MTNSVSFLRLYLVNYFTQSPLIILIAPLNLLYTRENQTQYLFRITGTWIGIFIENSSEHINIHLNWEGLINF